MAADAALQAHAYEEAVECYGWALDAHVCAAPDDAEASCELLLLRARAFTLSGSERAARQACRRAIDLAGAAGLPHILVAAARQLRPSVWQAYMPDRLALHAIELALPMLPESALALRASAHATLAILPPHSLRLATSRCMSAQAIHLAAESGDERLRLETERSQLFALCEPGSIEAQLRVCDVLLDHADDSTWDISADAYFARYHALMQHGDSGAAQATLEQYAELARERRLAVATWHVERLRAQRLFHAGQLDEAERRFESLAEQARCAKRGGWQSFYRMQRSVLARERTGSTALADTTPGPQWLEHLPEFRVQRVLSALEHAEPRVARHELKALAHDEFAAITCDPFSLCALVQLVDPVVSLDERELARALLKQLEPRAQLIALSPYTYSFGSVSYYLGRLCAYLERRSEACDHLERALRINARTGHELDRLRTCVALAEQLVDERLAADKRRARALADEARQNARQLGASAIEREADKVLRQIEAAAGERRKARRVAS